MTSALAEEERALLVRAGRGDAVAFEALAGPLIPGWIVIAARILSSTADAEDAVLRVLARLWERVRVDADSLGSIEAYGRRAVTNEALDALRTRDRRSSAAPQLALESEQPAGNPLDQLIDAESLRQLDSALAALDPETRQLLELHAFEGLSLSECAARFSDERGAPRSTEWAKKRYQRACRKLRDALAAEGGDQSER